MKPALLVWAAIIALVVAAFLVGTFWLVLAALGVGFVGAMNGAFGD